MATKYEKRWAYCELRDMSRPTWYIFINAIQNLHRPWAWGPFGLNLRRGVPNNWALHNDIVTLEFVLTWWDENDETRVYRQTRAR